jgi:hypothetical protein
MYAVQRCSLQQTKLYCYVAYLEINKCKNTDRSASEAHHLRAGYFRVVRAAAHVALLVEIAPENFKF